MKDLQLTADMSNINYINRKLFNKKNKYFCKLKTSKFRAQPIKLLVSILYFWKHATTDLREIQHLNFAKYNRIQLQLPNFKVGKKVSVVVELNLLNTLDAACQPWFTTLGTVLVFVNPTSNQLYLFNIKKIKDINITKSKTRMLYQSPQLVSHKNVKTSFKYSTKMFKSAKLLQRIKLFLFIKSKFKSGFRNQKKTYKKSALFKKSIKKFGKKWYNFERKKFKRFKNKYDGRDLKNTPLLAFCQLNTSKFKKWLFIRYQNRVLFIKNFITEEIARKKRLKLLLGDKKTKQAKKPKKTKQKKIKTKYPKFKYQYKRRKKTKKLKIINVQIKEYYIKKFHAVTTQKMKCKNTKHQYKLQKSTKIKFINKLFFKSKKVTSRKLSKHFIKSKNLKQTIKCINKQINYKIKWLNYYEFKSFRWKFHKKRWYFVMSRWKRLSEFRRMLRDAWRNHRKLQKNFLFIKLLRANFKHILGISEEELLKKWIKIRRGTNLNNTILPVEYLNQSLQLKLDSLSLFLGFAPNRLMAQEFIHFGGLRINGSVNTDKNFSLHQGDMLQLDTKVIQEIRVLYKDAHWNSVRARLKFVPFLQTQWSIMLFMLVRWPQSYELFEESILNQRWVRFFIRYFPIRISKYKKAKVKWYKY